MGVFLREQGVVLLILHLGELCNQLFEDVRVVFSLFGTSAAGAKEEDEGEEGQQEEGEQGQFELVELLGEVALDLVYTGIGGRALLDTKHDVGVRSGAET